MTKIYLRLLTYLVVILGSGVAGIYLYKSITDKPIIKSEHQLTVEKIEKMGKLELVRITIKDVQEQTIPRPMPLPDAKALLIVVGEVSAGIDLKKVTMADIVDSETQITVTLPKPQMLMARIDHSKSKIYDVKGGLWNTVELLDDAYKAAEVKIRQAAAETGYVEICKKNARELLTPLFGELARKKIVIEFKT